MASKNQVTLTFAGDSDKLEKAFDSVGQSADKMAGEVGTASKKVGTEAADSFDRVGLAADNVDTKAMGFRDTMTGVQDSMLGASQIAKGDLFQGFFTLGMGVGDLASGFYNFLIPSIKAASSGMISNALATGRATASSVVHRGATLAQAGATRVMTVAQRALNLAMRANPIGIIITVLAALGAALVVAYKKSETFRRIVDGAFKIVKNTAMAVGSAIKNAFSAAFNFVRGAWNSTVGGFGFSIPSWVPGVGGKEFRIPRMHTGGIVPGAPGQEVLRILQAGERVTPANQAGAAGGALVLRSDGSRLMRLLMEIIREAIRVEGGNVQVVLGQ
jgi:phage-related protein